MTIYYNIKKEIFFHRNRFNYSEEGDMFTIIKIKKSILFKSKILLN
jgi:hypothetical protein